jgi:hypothetical protein
MIVDLRFEGMGWSLPSTERRAGVSGAFDVGRFEDATFCNPMKTSI